MYLMRCVSGVNVETNVFLTVVPRRFADKADTFSLRVSNKLSKALVRELWDHNKLHRAAKNDMSNNVWI